MSRFTLSLAAALVAVVLAVPSFAAAQAKPSQAKAKSVSAMGTLQKVDGQNLTIQTSKGTETVMVAPNAQITMGSKKLSSADLASHTGDRVKVRYMDKNGQKEASSVSLSAAKPTQTASAKPATPKTSSSKKKS